MTIKKKGQSTLEYIILVAAVIVVVLAFLGTSGGFRGQLCSTLTKGVNKMPGMVDKWVLPSGCSHY